MLRRDFLALGALALVPRIAWSQAATPAPANVIDDLVAGNHILTQEGILDGYGHISVRHPGNPARFLLARKR